MKKTKKSRLEAAGWQVGSAGEFLELTAEERAFIEMKLALARNLRLRRTRRKLTQAQVAKLLESSQSRVAKMEAADSTVSLDLLVRALLALGAKTKDVARIITTAERRAA